VGKPMKTTVSTMAVSVLASSLLAAPPVWEPPRMWPDAAAAEPTGSRDFMPKLQVGSFSVVLETTPLQAASSHFRAAIGRRGDAGSSLEWVCLQGRDRQGKVVLWLENGEVHGSAIGGVLLQRLAAGESVDARCGRLAATPISMPLAVSLGMTRAQVVRALGRPTSDLGEVLLYSSCHGIKLSTERTREPQPFDLCSSLCISFKAGLVHAFEVWRTTTS
jgi:hypothetical protein